MIIKELEKVVQTTPMNRAITNPPIARAQESRNPNAMDGIKTTLFPPPNPRSLYIGGIALNPKAHTPCSIYLFRLEHAEPPI